MNVERPYPQPGDRVKVVQKTDYVTGKLTEGIVKEVLTKKRHHSRGHKVRLESGIIGRVQEFVDYEDNNQFSVKEKNVLDFDEKYDLR